MACINGETGEAAMDRGENVDEASLTDRWFCGGETVVAKDDAGDGMACWPRGVDVKNTSSSKPDGAVTIEDPLPR